MNIKTFVAGVVATAAITAYIVMPIAEKNGREAGLKEGIVKGKSEAGQNIAQFLNDQAKEEVAWARKNGFELGHYSVNRDSTLQNENPMSVNEDILRRFPSDEPSKYVSSVVLSAITKYEMAKYAPALALARK